jgi:protein O-GlcNAc transferase
VSPGATSLAAQVEALLQAGSFSEAVAAAEAALALEPDDASLWAALAAARLLSGEAIGAWRAAIRALDLNPGLAGARQTAALALDQARRPYRTALGQLSAPADEAGSLEAAYQAVVAADDAGLLEAEAEGVSLALFLRLAATEDADRRWPFADIGPKLALRGEHRHLLYQLPRVRDDADRRALLDQHRTWGRAVEAQAAAAPVTPAARGPRTRPRVGLMSSDLRIHVVGAFVDPLVDQAEAAGVELFCYSAQPGAPDGFQQHVAARSTFRHLPGADATGMARAIAADGLDVLIEIGGSTNNNRLEALAHRLAPRQISWLGYPHSAGLSTLDAMVLDPFLAPTRPDLLLEKPLLMPQTWAAMSPGYFRDTLPMAADLPQDRQGGQITFGSAGSPYKYSAATLDGWARVLAAVPGSRFLCVRPEGGSATFRANLTRAFLRRGVEAERLAFAPVRGGHLPFYDQMDISLDTFPLTGGMTTCEALWMGVPVVTLAGPSVHERISHSLLNNCGLGDLSVETVDGFVARAVALADDRDRRRAWRSEGRARIMGGVLGDLPQFGRDFFALVTAGI